MWINGKISDDEIDIEIIAYTNDNLDIIIADAIGMFIFNLAELKKWKL